MKCPNCNETNHERGAKFCHVCGAMLQTNNKASKGARVITQKCPTCGSSQPAGVRFCNNCGASISGNETQKTNMPLKVEFGNVFCTMRNFVGVMDIPPYLDGQKVTAIGEGAFCVCQGIKSVTIPDTVSMIGAEAFLSCTFSRIVIPNSVLSIGRSAFHMSKLSEIILSESLESIDDETFSECYNLSRITIPNSVKSIGTWAFKHSGLSEIHIPKSVKSIGSRAFQYCYNLHYINIPPTVEEIGRDAFSWIGEPVTIIIPRRFCTRDKIENITGAHIEHWAGCINNVLKDEYGNIIKFEDL